MNNAQFWGLTGTIAAGCTGLAITGSIIADRYMDIRNAELAHAQQVLVAEQNAEQEESGRVAQLQSTINTLQGQIEGLQSAQTQPATPSDTTNDAAIEAAQANIAALDAQIVTLTGQLKKAINEGPQLPESTIQPPLTEPVEPAIDFTAAADVPTLYDSWVTNNGGRDAAVGNFLTTVLAERLSKTGTIDVVVYNGNGAEDPSFDTRTTEWAYQGATSIDDVAGSMGRLYTATRNASDNHEAAVESLVEQGTDEEGTAYIKLNTTDTTNMDGTPSLTAVIADYLVTNGSTLDEELRQGVSEQGHWVIAQQFSTDAGEMLRNNGVDGEYVCDFLTSPDGITHLSQVYKDVGNDQDPTNDTQVGTYITHVGTPAQIDRLGGEE